MTYTEILAGRFKELEFIFSEFYSQDSSRFLKVHHHLPFDIAHVTYFEITTEVKHYKENILHGDRDWETH